MHTIVNKLTIAEAIEAMEMGSQFELRDDEHGPGRPVIFQLDEFHHQFRVVERLGDSETILSVFELIDIKVTLNSLSLLSCTHACTHAFKRTRI